jgi:hypothetical protein
MPYITGNSRNRSRSNHEEKLSKLEKQVEEAQRQIESPKKSIRIGFSNGL